MINRWFSWTSKVLRVREHVLHYNRAAMVGMFGTFMSDTSHFNDVL